MNGGINPVRSAHKKPARSTFPFYSRFIDGKFDVPKYMLQRVPTEQRSATGLITCVAFLDVLPRSGQHSGPQHLRRFAQTCVSPLVLYILLPYIDFAWHLPVWGMGIVTA